MSTDLSLLLLLVSSFVSGRKPTFVTSGLVRKSRGGHEIITRLMYTDKQDNSEKSINQTRSRLHSGPTH